MQILIVEDQLDALECLRFYFTEHGHDVMTASTVKEALVWLDCSEPQFAFIDLMLPGGSGSALIREIAKRNLPTRMVVITASDDLRLRQELLGLGVSDYLFKPVTLRDIEAFLESVHASVPPTEAGK